jgi:hypothetical protein
MKYDNYIYAIGLGIGGALVLDYLSKNVNVLAGTVPLASPVTGGGNNCSHTVYPATGRKQVPGDKLQHITYASSHKGTTSRRINADNVPFSSYEANWYLTLNGQNCGKGYNQATIKMWGPTHSDSNCCWALLVIDDKGNLSFGGEGPHPHTSTSQKKIASLGSLTGKSLGLKGIIWPLATGGAHLEAWVDLGAGWKKMGTWDRATVGFSKTETKPAANQEVEFRIDCVGVTVKCAQVNEIKPGVSGAPTTAGAARVDSIDCGFDDNELHNEYNTPLFY